ncbi:cytidylate kinase family protein [Candidatus Woesearchaeota archaeon]|nr:cytidylate kinase family protein [Candidatus Woesearchaeota archaeon]
MIITISGTPGSGKSTLAQLLTQKLGAVRIYVGGIRRDIAASKNVTLEELNKYALTHPETDVDVDKAAAKQARDLEKKNKIVIVEGRTQFHFLPESLKIFIGVDDIEGARRIWKTLKSDPNRKNEGTAKTLKDTVKLVHKRDEMDQKRYKKYYQLDYRDLTHYDLVVDTTHISKEETLEKVLSYIKLNKKAYK